ncbi:hypothetical protein ACFE04_017941 [Oxalis oulophora]
MMGASTTISRGVTSVDCQKQVRSWRFLRTLVELLIPSCNHTFLDQQETNKEAQQNYPPPRLSSVSSSSSNTITGTIFGFRHGKANFCIQKKNNNPIFVLELAVPTTTLAKEMQGGTLRIALQSKTVPLVENGRSSDSGLMMAPSWTMFCNGRKVGYAVKRKPSKAELDALRLMNSGVGTISGKELLGDCDDEILYLRSNFKRNRGGPNSESFHLIDPDGNLGQELSIFFFSFK